MLNRNNSLLNLTLILFTLYFSTALFAENHDFIFPKKKLPLLGLNNEKIKSEIVKIDGKFEILPKKKPLKKIASDNSKNKNLSKPQVSKEMVSEVKIYSYDFPQKKPFRKLSLNKKKLNIEKKIKTIDLTSKAKIELKIEEVKNNKNNLKNKKNIQTKLSNNFLFPTKKPLTFKPAQTKTLAKSNILNKKDYSVAKEVLNYIKKKKWTSALSLTKKVKDKEFKNLITWMYLKESGNQATFQDYQNFISKNYDYPRISRLRYLAEHKIILQNTSPNVIINWFNDEEPLSGTGKIKLGEAYLEKNEIELGTSLIRSGWVDADLTKGDLRYYRNKFKKFLSTNDHLKRADYLAWDNQYWDLKRMLRYLPAKERLLYNARFILMTNSYGVDKAISDVPNNLKNDLGLQYNRLVWRTKRNRLEDSLEILRKFHGEETLIYPKHWWKLRENITRDLIYEKKYNLAYEVSSNHHLSEGAEFADAEWISGWLALSFLNKPDLAIEHFENFYKNVGYPISLARGAYWLGLANEKKENKETANKFFNEGAKFSNTYYGQLSFNKVKLGKDFKLSRAHKIKDGYEKKFNKNKLIRHVKLLKELDSTKFSKDIVKHLATLDVENGSEILAAKLSTEIGRFDYAIQISKKASYEKRFINIFNYPVIEIPKKINNKIMPSQNLLLAIIRQESEFDARANSYVGARGLMQIMPATAKLVAKKIKTTYNKNLLTKDVNYNIKLGTYYFNSLLEDYDGVFPFAIGAYNAGPNRIKSWIKRYGDPNKNEISFVDWIELIRFKETRNYVQRVMENINVYKYILGTNSIKIDRFFRQ